MTAPSPGVSAIDFAVALDHYPISTTRRLHEEMVRAVPCAGLSHPGTSALTVMYEGEKVAVPLQWNDLEPDYVRYMVRNAHLGMPRFRKTDVSDAELDALATWMTRRNK